MKRISAGRVGILQGSRVLFSDFADGGVMWTGQGDRESRHVISFKPPFTEPPAVIVAVPYAALIAVPPKSNTPSICTVPP